MKKLWITYLLNRLTDIKKIGVNISKFLPIKRINRILSITRRGGNVVIKDRFSYLCFTSTIITM